MQDSDHKEFYLALKDALEVKGKALSAGAFKLWCRLLQPYELDHIKAAIDQAIMAPSFMLEPAKILEFLPDMLGHATPEIAWSLYPRTEADSGYVTDEIMQAGNGIDPLDKMARMPFIEAYKQIIASAKMNQKPAHWFYSVSTTGTREEQKETKIQRTLEAMQCGRLTEARAKNTVMLLSQELGKQSSQYLPGLPEPKQKMTLTDQRQQIGIISKRINTAFQQTSEPSNLTEEETEKARLERVKKIQADFDIYNADEGLA
ncbi:MAG: hypothetical protein JKY52_09135 [Flavobacteriales bacterium]|nr:hypothetical protein [Flavobacteriales bacterium]